MINKKQEVKKSDERRLKYIKSIEDGLAKCDEEIKRLQLRKEDILISDNLRKEIELMIQVIKGVQIKKSATLKLAISGLSYEPDIPRFK